MMSTTTRQTGARNALLIALLLLAFALRVYRLDHHDIWGDEAWSITVSSWPLRAIVGGSAETNPPLYHILLHLTRALWGSTPFALRYLSVCLGMLSVALIARLGRAIDRPLGAVALALAAVSPLLVWYAQETRMYGPALVGASASLLLFWRIWQRQRHGRRVPHGWWLLYGAAGLIAVYSHYYAFSVLLAQALLIGATAARRRVRPPAVLRLWLWTWLGMALLFLPWLNVHRQFIGGKTSSRFDEWTLAQLASIGRRTLIAFTLGESVRPEQTIAAWGLALLAALGALALWQRGRRAAVALLLTLALGGQIFAWAINPIMPFFYPRYLLVTLPGWLLLLAAGAALARRPAGRAALTLLVATTAIVPLRQYYNDPAFVKGGYGRAMALVTQHAQPGDILLLNGALQMSLYDYYAPAGIPATLLPNAALLTDDSTAALLTATTDGYQRVWLVQSGNPAEYDPAGRAAAWLAQNGSFARHVDYAGVSLDLFVLSFPTTPRQPAALRFGDALLLDSYAVGSPTLRAGEPLLLTLFWQTLAPPPADYTVFVHVLNGDGQIVAQVDRPPLGGSRPTSGWIAGEALRDSYAVPLPADLPPARYAVRVGLYAWPDLTPLPTRGAADGAPLLALDIIP